MVIMAFQTLVSVLEGARFAHAQSQAGWDGRGVTSTVPMHTCVCITDSSWCRFAAQFRCQLALSSVVRADTPIAISCRYFVQEKKKFGPHFP